jgi:hypothetical protein
VAGRAVVSGPELVEQVVVEAFDVDGPCLAPEAAQQNSPPGMLPFGARRLAGRAAMKVAGNPTASTKARYLASAEERRPHRGGERRINLLI